MSTVTERLPLINLPIGEHKRGLGTLEVQRGATGSRLPLKDVSITARVGDRVASVELKQKFFNNFNEHLEAVYIFPLSGGCVVSHFEMRVGDRVVKGLVKERQQARADYQQAVKCGQRAALLEQERDDVFTLQVGHIPPNEEVTIALTYSERLPFFENGKTELRLPLVVAPRYVPGTPVTRDSVGAGIEHDTDQVPDASRITPPRLVEGFDPKVGLKLEVEILQIDASGADSISELACSQHATKLNIDNGAIKVELSRNDERLNRDFVLSWRLASKAVKSSLLVFRDPKGDDYGMLSITPPRRAGFLGAPRDVIFVLDRSGSMNGIKMQSAAKACSLLLHTLGPADRFAIQAFDTVIEWMTSTGTNGGSGTFFDASEELIEKGDAYLRSIGARGGTELGIALLSALDFTKNCTNTEGRVPIVVLITDGEVAHEAAVLKQIQKNIGDARIFSIGVDTAVNSGLLRRIANLGGGTASFVAPGTDLENALQSVSREIGEPIITGLSIVGCDGLEVSLDSIAPCTIPDLFAGRAVTAFVKVSGKGALTVRGHWSDGKVFEERVKPKALPLPAIAQLWGKSHLLDLEDQYRLTPQDSLKERMIEIAVEHSLLTKFTGFVSIDEAEVVNQTGAMTSVVQPVEQPSGWVERQAPLKAQLASCNEPTAPGWGASLLGFASPSPKMRRAASANNLNQAQMDQVFGDLSSDSKDNWSSPAQSQPASTNSQPYDAWQAESTADSLSSGASVTPPGAPPPNAPPPPPTNTRRAQKQAGGKFGSSVTGKLVNWLFGDTPDDVSTQISARDLQKERKYVLEATNELVRMIEACLADLRKGDVPESAVLQAARKTLLELLNESESGTELPLLQRFIRAQLKELISSLTEDEANASELLPLWERYHSKLLEARREAENLFAGVESAPDKECFWESSV